MYKDAKPEILIHLTSHVSGLGLTSNIKQTFSIKNLMIQDSCFTPAWKNNVKNVAATSTGCGYPEFAPVPPMKVASGTFSKKALLTL